MDTLHISPTRQLHITLQRMCATQSPITIDHIAGQLQYDTGMVLTHLQMLEVLDFIKLSGKNKDLIWLTQSGLCASVSPGDVN